jgi:hypothetical protein
MKNVGYPENADAHEPSTKEYSNRWREYRKLIRKEKFLDNSTIIQSPKA